MSWNSAKARSAPRRSVNAVDPTRSIMIAATQRLSPWIGSMAPDPVVAANLELMSGLEILETEVTWPSTQSI
jgi:hypothetical protein